jgi:hypothetical protein
VPGDYQSDSGIEIGLHIGTGIGVRTGSGIGFSFHFGFGVRFRIGFGLRFGFGTRLASGFTSHRIGIAPLRPPTSHPHFPLRACKPSAWTDFYARLGHPRPDEAMSLAPSVQQFLARRTSAGAQTLDALELRTAR